MRLKGGKVLLDLSFTEVANEPELTLSDEELKAILEKGCEVLVQTSIGNVIIPLVFNFYEEFDYRVIHFLYDADDSSYYNLKLELETKKISIILAS